MESGVIPPPPKPRLIVGNWDETEYVRVWLLFPKAKLELNSSCWSVRVVVSCSLEIKERPGGGGGGGIVSSWVFRAWVGGMNGLGTWLFWLWLWLLLLLLGVEMSVLAWWLLDWEDEGVIWMGGVCSGVGIDWYKIEGEGEFDLLGDLSTGWSWLSNIGGESGRGWLEVPVVVVTVISPSSPNGKISSRNPSQ